MLMSPDQPPGKPLAMAQVSRLRFRHLHFLDILGRTRNLRQTAEQMHITQPAATKVLMMFCVAEIATGSSRQDIRSVLTAWPQLMLPHCASKGLYW